MESKSDMFFDKNNFYIWISACQRHEAKNMRSENHSMNIVVDEGTDHVKPSTIC